MPGTSVGWSPGISTGESGLRCTSLRLLLFDGVFDRPLDLLCRTIDCKHQVVSLVSHCNRAETCQPCFNHTTLVIGAMLVPIVITQVDFYARDAIRETIQRATDDAGYPLRDVTWDNDMIVVIDFNVHGHSFFGLPIN